MKWHSFPAVRWALFRIRGPRSYAMTSGSSSYSVSWLCKKKKTWWTCRLYSVGLFLSLFFPCLLKKLQKRERTCRAYMKVMERRFRPTLLAPPPPHFFSPLSCWPQPKFSSMLPLHCHVSPPSSPSFIFFLYLYLYMCMFLLPHARRHTSCIIWGGGRGGSYLCSCACLFSFSTCDDSGELLLSFPLFPIVSLLYVFTPRLHVWMASPSLVPLVYFCLNLFFFFFCLHLQPERALQSSSLLNIANLAHGSSVWKNCLDLFHVCFW